MQTLCGSWLEDRDTGVDVNEAWLASAAERVRCLCEQRGVSQLLELGENPADAAAFQEAKDRLDEACGWVRGRALEELARIRNLEGGQAYWTAWQDWRLAVQGVGQAVDILEQLFEWRAGTSRDTPWRRHHAAMRSLRWIEYSGKEGKEEPVATKVQWTLLLQVRAEVEARRQGVFLCDNLLYRRAPFTPYGGAPLMRPGKNETLSLEEWLWTGVVPRNRQLDAELLSKVRTTPAIVGTTAGVLEKLHGDGMPRATPNHEYIAFRNGCLALVTEGRPGLRFLPNGSPELNGVLASTAHDYDFDEGLLTRPLPPCLRAHDRLAWMRDEPVPVEAMDLDAEGRHLGVDARVMWYIFSQQPFSAQTSWTLLAMLGRALYENCQYDGWESFLHINGTSRCGKGVAVLQFLKQALGPAAFGQLNADRGDTFALAGSAAWRLLFFQEFRTRAEGMPGLSTGQILSIVSGEPYVIREMNKPPRTVERCTWGLMSTANHGIRLQEHQGEISGRLIEVQMKRSWLGREDTTLPRRRQAEIAADLVLTLRAYIETLEALGPHSIRSALPRDLVEAAERSKIANDYLAMFLADRDWCILAEPGAIAAKLREPYSDAPPTPICTLDHLGHAFAEWMRDKGAGRYPWVPRRYAPILAAHGIAWGDPLTVSEYPLNAYVAAQGMVHGVGVTREVEERMRRRELAAEQEEPPTKRQRF